MAKYNETLANRITTLIAEELCSVSDICKATGISRNTFYKWKRENPVFNEEIEEATEYRNEILLSMAYSSIKQRLEKHTIVIEKDIYVPDETDSGNMKFKSKTITKKELLPDLRTIKMVLDRVDRQKENKTGQAITKEEPSTKPVEKTEVCESIIDKSEKSENNNTSLNKKSNVENIKSHVKILKNNKQSRITYQRKGRLLETA